MRDHAEHLDNEARPESASQVPYVVVATRELADPELTVPLLRVHGPRGSGSRPGIVDRHHGEGGLAAYRPVEQSPAEVYLLVDVERGDEFRDVAPQAATSTVLGRGRTPLTIEEGIALATQVPGVLEKNHCFSLAGSRRLELAGDRRVPALWISDRAPKLGWCWDGNPHSWLGLASAGDRIG